MNLLEQIDKKFNRLQESEELDEKRERLTDEEDEELDEMNVTGALDGGAGPPKTPRAFKKNGKKSKYKVKNSDKPFTTKTTNESKYVRMAKVMNEISYKEFKNSDEGTPKQKVNKRISEINKNLYQLERIVKQTRKLKMEMGVTQDNFWKSTAPKMIKIRERLLRVAKEIVEINS